MKTLFGVVVATGILFVSLGMSIGRSGLAVAAPATLPATKTKAVPVAAYREITWNELVPKEWDPIKAFKRRNGGILFDGSPEADDAMRDMRATWDNAPTVSAMDGADVKLPGYIVPLEEVKGELREFLLVPYFGACIHTPPPPANQIVYVVPGTSMKGFHAMETVWVSGRISTARQDSYMGASGYRLNAAAVERYVPKPR